MSGGNEVIDLLDSTDEEDEDEEDASRNNPYATTAAVALACVSQSTTPFLPAISNHRLFGAPPPLPAPAPTYDAQYDDDEYSGDEYSDDDNDNVDDAQGGYIDDTAHAAPHELDQENQLCALDAQYMARLDRARLHRPPLQPQSPVSAYSSSSSSPYYDDDHGHGGKDELDDGNDADERRRPYSFDVPAAGSGGNVREYDELDSSDRELDHGDDDDGHGPFLDPLSAKHHGEDGEGGSWDGQDEDDEAGWDDGEADDDQYSSDTPHNEPAADFPVDIDHDQLYGGAEQDDYEDDVESWLSQSEQQDEDMVEGVAVDAGDAPDSALSSDDAVDQPTVMAPPPPPPLQVAAPSEPVLPAPTSETALPPPATPSSHAHKRPPPSPSPTPTTIPATPSPFAYFETGDDDDGGVTPRSKRPRLLFSASPSLAAMLSAASPSSSPLSIAATPLARRTPSVPSTPWSRLSSAAVHAAESPIATPTADVGADVGHVFARELVPTPPPPPNRGLQKQSHLKEVAEEETTDPTQMASTSSPWSESSSFVGSFVMGLVSRMQRRSQSRLSAQSSSNANFAPN
ncbi:hypothetical protein BC828DRAFT_394245 [Blastocladiella britannica]|nr:hypothetical protein BC828DRAFT_394245 [Blastocladiella britannica]